jgi:hypothetical protein
LVEDAANGPAILSELRREISGMLAVKPEGGKQPARQPTLGAGTVGGL